MEDFGEGFNREEEPDVADSHGGEWILETEVCTSITSELGKLRPEAPNTRPG